MNTYLKMFTRSCFQERPLSQAAPTQSQGEFSQVNKVTVVMVLLHIVVLMLIAVFVAVMRVQTKKIILNQIILQPTLIFKGAF